VRGGGKGGLPVVTVVVGSGCVIVIALALVGEDDAVLVQPGDEVGGERDDAGADAGGAVSEVVSMGVFSRLSVARCLSLRKPVVVGTVEDVFPCDG
jgi:hypothetical protein